MEILSVIIGLFCAVFGAAFLLNLVGTLIGMFGKIGVWVALLLFLAVYALLFATEGSWLMFFPRLVGNIISIALNFSSIIVMIYFIYKMITSKSFLFIYVLCALGFGIYALYF